MSTTPDGELLDRMPEAAVATFAGMAAVSVTAVLWPGERVLDLSRGAGLDSRAWSHPSHPLSPGAAPAAANERPGQPPVGGADHAHDRGHDLVGEARAQVLALVGARSVFGIGPGVIGRQTDLGLIISDDVRAASLLAGEEGAVVLTVASSALCGTPPRLCGGRARAATRSRTASTPGAAGT
jgi:hypothetical protein